jgi:hypothetical protein
MVFRMSLAEPRDGTSHGIEKLNNHATLVADSFAFRFANRSVSRAEDQSNHSVT